MRLPDCDAVGAGVPGKGSARPDVKGRRSQPWLFDGMDEYRPDPRRYQPWLTVTENRKGVVDVDTVKGCTHGMRAYPQGGCYGECYAAKTARQYGINFGQSVSRQFCGREHRDTLVKRMLPLRAKWYRVGTAGDPCHDWTHTIAVLRVLRWTKKIPVVITKHWVALTDKQIDDLRWLKAVVNTSTSALDTDREIRHRLEQRERLRAGGVRSVLRVVTCDFGTSEWARARRGTQEHLLALEPSIDNPLRVRRSNPHVLSGAIRATRRQDSIGGGKLVSVHSPTAYLGTCQACPDQCGVGAGCEAVGGEATLPFH
jgi:hypothetical protein